MGCNSSNCHPGNQENEEACSGFVIQLYLDRNDHNRERNAHLWEQTGCSQPSINIHYVDMCPKSFDPAGLIKIHPVISKLCWDIVFILQKSRLTSQNAQTATA